MLSSTAADVVRRAVAAHSNANFEGGYQLPAWGTALLAVTVLLFFSLNAMIEYTFGRIIPTLIIIESPQSILFETLPNSENQDPDAPLSSYPDEKKDQTAVESELLLVKQPLITSSFRTTIKHLKSRAGRMSRFRGVGVFMVYTSALYWSTSLLTKLPFIPSVAAPVIAHVLCAQLSMTWTHIVISDPSPLPWYKRIPSIQAWKKIAGPTAVVAIAHEATVLLALFLAIALSSGLSQESIMAMTSSERKILAAQGISILALCLALRALIVLPATVSLTRVQASLLAPETETIVPFDRTFKGKFDTESDEALGMRDAWSTFGWNDRVRLVKAYAKVVVMSSFVSVLFFAAIVGELILIMGNDIQKFLPKKGDDGLYHVM